MYRGDYPSLEFLLITETWTRVHGNRLAHVPAVLRRQSMSFRWHSSYFASEMAPNQLLNSFSYFPAGRAERKREENEGDERKKNVLRLKLFKLPRNEGSQIVNQHSCIETICRVRDQHKYTLDVLRSS